MWQEARLQEVTSQNRQNSLIYSWYAFLICCQINEGSGSIFSSETQWNRSINLYRINKVKAGFLSNLVTVTSCEQIHSSDTTSRLSCSSEQIFPFLICFPGTFSKQRSFQRCTLFSFFFFFFFLWSSGTLRCAQNIKQPFWLLPQKDNWVMDRTTLGGFTCHPASLLRVIAASE